MSEVWQSLKREKSAKEELVRLLGTVATFLDKQRFGRDEEAYERKSLLIAVRTAISRLTRSTDRRE